MFDKHKGKKSNPSRANEPGLEPQAPVSSPASGSRTTAVVGPGIMIKGDITGDENLRIEGKVNGSVHIANHEVTVGQSGEIMADVTAKVIRVAGRVLGDLTASEKVILSKTGKVRGNIVAPRMTLEDGAIFKGTIDMDPGEPVKAATANAKATPKAPPKETPKAASSPGLVADAAKKSPDLALKRG